MLFLILKILFSVGRCQQPEMKLLFFFLFFLHGKLRENFFVEENKKIY